MLPELKQAIIKHLPDYFSWDQERQEEFRVNMPEEDSFKVEQFLMKALVDITVTNEDQMDEAKGDLTDAQYQDIMANFDPNILKFRKKYKIVCHKDSGLI